jgi:hypothetical protein
MYKKLIFLFSLCYLASYVFLSVFGRYEGNYSAIEKIIGPCLCASSVEQWQPAYTIFAKGMSEKKLYTNYLGKIYYPLILADQSMWHVNKEIPIRFFTPEELEIQEKNLREHGHI